MIIGLNQTRSDVKFSYDFTNKGVIICNSYIPITLLGREIHFTQNDKIIYKIESSLVDDLKRFFSITYPVYKSYFIKDGEDKAIGYILIKRSSFWFGYLYYELMINNEVYTIYEVGKGKEGIFLPIYKNEKQVALIEKDIIVRDNKDTYKIYLQEEQDTIPTMIFNVLYDAVRWANTAQYAYKKKEYDFVYTFNKTLKSKYDPKFKENILE